MKNNKKGQTTLLNYGNNEDGIGFNFYRIEHTNPDGSKKSIIIDSGNKFPGHENKSIKNLFIDSSKHLAKADALFLSHGHLDHIGAVAHLIRLGHRVPPIYASVYTLANMEAMLSKLGIPKEKFPKVNIIGPSITKTYSDTNIGGISVRAFPTSHSIPGALAFGIKTPTVTMFSTGDGRLNPMNYGHETNLTDINEYFKGGVDYMLLDSTSTVSDKMPTTEAEIIEQAIDILEDNADKKIVVSMISNNQPRMLSWLVAAGMAGYDAVDIKGWAAVQSFENARLAGKHDPKADIELAANRMLHKYGKKHGIKVYTTKDKKGGLDRKKVLTAVTGVNGEEYAILDRMSKDMYPNIKADENTVIIYSQRVIPVPGNQELRDNMNALFESLGAKTIEGMHASGHSSRPETIQFIEAVTKDCDTNKITGVPIHGSKIHLEATASLIKDMGFRNFDMKSGDIVLMEPGRAEIIGHEKMDFYAIKSRALANHQMEDTYYKADFVNGKLVLNTNENVIVKISEMIPYTPSEGLRRFKSGAAVKSEQRAASRKAQKELYESLSDEEKAIKKIEAEEKKARQEEQKLERKAKVTASQNAKQLNRLKENAKKAAKKFNDMKLNVGTSLDKLAQAEQLAIIAQQKVEMAMGQNNPAKQKLAEVKETRVNLGEKLEQAKKAAKAPQLKQVKSSYQPGVIPQREAAKARKTARVEAERVAQDTKLANMETARMNKQERDLKIRENHQAELKSQQEKRLQEMAAKKNAKTLEHLVKNLQVMENLLNQANDESEKSMAEIALQNAQTALDKFTKQNKILLLTGEVVKDEKIKNKQQERG